MTCYITDDKGELLATECCNAPVRLAKAEVHSSRALKKVLDVPVYVPECINCGNEVELP